MRHVVRSPLLLAVAAAALTLSGCGSENDSGEAEPSVSSTPTDTPTAPSGASGKPSAESTPEQDPDTVTIEMTVRGDIIKPGPSTVTVKRGKPVVFLIDSDRPGGLHVHSSPEQSPEFEAGKSTITVTLDMPGVVEVEEHEADALVAQLEVR